MTERPKPYVGVSGVVSPEQQSELNEIAMPLFDHGRRLALGVKAVRNTQWLDRENKFGRLWYPVGEEIAGTLKKDDHLRVAQVYLDQSQARFLGEKDYEKRFVDKLLNRTGDMLNGIQFDMLPWDSEGYKELFGHIKAERPEMTILLQAHRGQMEKHGPNELLRRLSWYHDQIDYVLFDASHGTGKTLDVDALVQFVAPAYRRTHFGIGVAGGLDGPTVETELPKLLEQFPDLSFDAEGKLHTDTLSTGALNMKVTKEYLEAAERAIRFTKRPTV
jgi:hypothetical protein